jgi:hypothetical protein
MSNTYVGGMTSWGTVAAMQQAAEAENANPELLECGHTVDETGRVVLEGESPIATEPVSAVVPNLTIEHVRTPVAKHGLPDLQTSLLGRQGGRGQEYPSMNDHTAVDAATYDAARFNRLPGVTVPAGADHHPHLRPASWVPEPVFPERAAEEAADEVMEVAPVKPEPVREPVKAPAEDGQVARGYLPPRA